MLLLLQYCSPVAAAAAAAAIAYHRLCVSVKETQNDHSTNHMNGQQTKTDLAAAVHLHVGSVRRLDNIVHLVARESQTPKMCGGTTDMQTVRGKTQHEQNNSCSIFRFFAG